MMPKKKRRGANECIQELERQLGKASKQHDERKVCDLCVELGEEYRRISDLSAALNYYRRGAELAERLKAYENASYAHRGIAEILVDPSIQENAKALHHGKKYLEAANKSGKVHFIQLAYHVFGWLHLQIYLNSDAKQEILLAKGKQWCERSLSFLSKHAADIDCDRDAVKMGQDSRSRKARLQQILSQICDKMNLHQLALRYHNAALAYATRANDHDLQYRCLLSKLNFSGDQRLKTAIELVHVAANLDQQASCEAKFILAQEKIRVKDFVGAKWDLISMLASKEHEKLDPEEQKTFYEILIMAYKTVERLRMLPAADEYLKMRICEKIADSLYEAGFSDIALEFYKQMLSYADRTEDKVKALVSVAETAKELSRYNEAYDCFVEVEHLENTLNICDSKKADTAICIASSAANIGTLAEEKVLELFRKAEMLACLRGQKKTLYGYWLEYVRNTANEDLRIEIERKLKGLEVEIEDEEEDGQQGSEEGVESSYVDRWDQLSDTQILARCHEEASRQSMEERVRLEKDKKINLYGETRMHEAARGNDPQYLKMLIKMEYNLNARDEGGWTPLHEAVGALKLENVRILAQNGANLNLRSNEGTLSAEGERTDSGGLTPLMEACDRGATAIVNILLQFGANVALKNRDDWTALDFLLNAMKMGMVEKEDVPEAKRLVLIMEKKLKEANITVSTEPPPKKLKMDSKPIVKSRSENNAIERKVLDPNVENLHEYRKMMNALGRGATTHDRTNILLDGLDDDGIFDEGDEEVLGHLEPPLDDVLVGISDFNEAPSTSHFSASSTSSRQQIMPKKTVENANQVYSTLAVDDDWCTDFHDELPCTSTSITASDESVHSALNNNKRRKNRSRAQIERAFSDDDSDGEPIVVSHRATGSSRSTGNEQQTFNNYRACSSGISDNKVSGNRTRQPLSSQNLRDSGNAATAEVTKVGTAPASSSSKNQILIKVVVKKDDGTHYKTKGMPFLSSCTIGDVRKRCDEELKGDVEYSSMTICHDDCELSDDTPIELILADGNRILECVISGWSKPSASQIYAKRTKRGVMSNIVRALDESSSGCLDLREMNIGQDDAVCAAVETISEKLTELCLDGNILSAAFIGFISKILRQLKILSIPCCALESRNLRYLIGDYSPCSRLNKLDMSFNNFNDVSCNLLETFISMCPNLTQLKLTSCSLSPSTVDSLIRQIMKMSSLEVLDLSFNQNVNSEHASDIVRTCDNLKSLNLSCTGVTAISSTLENERKLEVLNLSLCDLHNWKDVVHWSLAQCPNMQCLDLSAVATIDCSIIEMCLKLKDDKAPFTTYLLADCTQLEAEVEKIAGTLKAILTTNSTARFQFSCKRRLQIEEFLPDGFKFCLK